LPVVRLVRGQGPSLPGGGRVCHRHRLLDVHGAARAGRSVPVKDTIGDVRGLLNLVQQQPWAQRVKGSGRHEEGVARVDGMILNVVEDRPVANRDGEASGGMPGFTPAMRRARSSASRMCHASVLPNCPGPSSWIACSSLGCTCTESQSAQSSNLMRRGKRVPVRATAVSPSRVVPSSAATSASVRPANGPLAIRLRS